MAKQKSDAPASEKPAKSFEKILHSPQMIEARQKAGVTLSNETLEYIVRLVKACS